MNHFDRNLTSIFIMRADGRQDNQLRPYSVEFGFIEERLVTGSCQWTQGSSEVIAIIYGPNQPKYSRHERFDRLTISVDCKVLSDFDRKDEMKALNHRFANQLESIICCEKYPRTHLEVVVHIIKDDGAIEAVAFNASIIALMNCGIAMLSTPMATSLVISADEESNTRIILDPTKDEESRSRAIIDAVTKHDPFLDQEEIGALKTTGQLTIEEIDEGALLAMKCASKLRDFARTLF
jgi:ribonuclease PH